MRYMIKLATMNDILYIQQICRQYPSELAFVRRVSLERGITNNELYIAIDSGVVIGFVNFHTRRDGISTIYDIAVDKNYVGQGIGRMLLYSVPCPFRLKCTEDNVVANKFYVSCGMRLVGVDQGRKRPLNVYQMNILNIVVRGSCKRTPDICKLSGSAYGIQEHNKFYAPVFMLDIDFKHPNWVKYIKVVRKIRPVQALVVDYSDPNNKCRMLAQVNRLRKLGVLRIVVCAKFHGAVPDIPKDCVVGVSLKTDGKLAKGKDNKFAGFMIDFNELKDRQVHLLGGSPKLQIDSIKKLRRIGAKVLSVDGNAQFGAAGFSSVYYNAKWNRRTDKDAPTIPYFDAALTSTINIQKELNAIDL